MMRTTPCACGDQMIAFPDREYRERGALHRIYACLTCCVQRDIQVLACDHARADLDIPSADSGAGEAQFEWSCPDCGHRWLQVGMPCRAELGTRQEAWELGL